MSERKPRRVLLRERLEASPEVRFERLDPYPMEEAVLPPRPLRMSDLVAQYVRVQAEAHQAPEDDEDDFHDVDPQDQVLTEHQVLGMAYELEAEEAFFPAEPSERQETDAPFAENSPEEATDNDPAPAPGGAQTST